MYDILYINYESLFCNIINHCAVKYFEIHGSIIETEDNMQCATYLTCQAISTHYCLPFFKKHDSFGMNAHWRSYLQGGALEVRQSRTLTQAGMEQK